MMVSWVYVPSLVMLCQRAAASQSNLIGCCGQTVLNLNKPLTPFLAHGMNIICAKFPDDWAKIVIEEVF